MRKLTKWFPFDIKPVHVGEYNASVCRDKDIRRWWDGSRWSMPYLSQTSDSIKASKRKNFTQATWASIEWRGLAEKPRKP